MNTQSTKLGKDRPVDSPPPRPTDPAPNPTPDRPPAPGPSPAPAPSPKSPIVDPKPPKVDWRLR